MDNKDSFNRVGIARNDEPTRFLTEEEMEQLEQARFNYEHKTEDVSRDKVEKNNKIKIEDIAPEKKHKPSVLKKAQVFSEKVKVIVKKICVVASFVIVAILGFYLAFSWNMPIDRDKDDVAKTNIQQQTQVDNSKRDAELKDFNNELDDDVNTFERKVNHAKQIVNDINEDVNKDGTLKEKVVEVGTTAKGFVEEHTDDMDTLKYKLEILINKFLH